MPDRGPDIQRFRGCLLGSAVGGALGKPVEALSQAEIQAYFGPSGITQYAPVDGRIGLITGDSQISLYTAEGLLRSWVRANLKGITHHPSLVMNAYVRWLETQGKTPPAGLGFGEPGVVGWLNRHSELHARRTSGKTIIKALTSARHIGDRATNSSAGAAVLSRGLAAGLFSAGSTVESAFELGKDLAALTHGGPGAAGATGALTALTSLLARGEERSEAVETVAQLLLHTNAPGSVIATFNSAVAMGSSNQPVSYDLPRLGATHLAPGCLAFAVYCLLKSHTFAEGLILAVNHDGDSDTVASIAGGLLGAVHGDGAILPCWLEPLELRDLVSEVATDLFDFRSWDVRGDQQRIWAKYPGY